MKRFLILLAAALALLTPARAQIAVDISIKQRLFIRHEPILATITVTNQTGRDITLADARESQWFSFQISSEGDHFVPPRNPDYHLPPLPMRAGETLKRTVNLSELYDLGDFGIYRIRANIYFAEADKYFSSKPTHVDITEGRIMWRRTAGVPSGQKNAGQTHIFSLLAHQHGEQNTLYISVEDQDQGTVFCTSTLGRIIDGAAPEIQFDSSNNLYILHLVAQRTFVLTKISVNGEYLGQTTYTAPKTRPTLRKLPDGTLQLIGGHREAPVSTDPSEAPAPLKLSARPPGLPQS